MKFVYFGSSRFSRIALEELWLNGYKPTLVVSKPDKPKGRGLRLTPTAVSRFSVDKRLPLIKPLSLKTDTIKLVLAKEAMDFFIVADYGEVIPPGLLDLPLVLPLCIHPSLLPRYRGASPIERTLINGDDRGGVTVFKINDRVDAGEIIRQKSLTVDYNDDFFSLSDRLAKEGVWLLIEAVKKIATGNYHLIPQDDKLATRAVKLKKEDGRISWSSSAGGIRNLIRATLGWPSAYTFYHTMQVKILSADITGREADGFPGVITNIDKEGIDVVTGKGTLKVKRLKPQGKKEMDAWSFACGYRVKSGESFS